MNLGAERGHLGRSGCAWAFGNCCGRDARAPSDVYLATGYDKERLALSHTSSEPVVFRVDADLEKSDPDSIKSVRAFCSQNSTAYEVT